MPMRVGREVYRRLTEAEIRALNEGSPEAQARFDEIKTEIERQYPFHEQIADPPRLPRSPGRDFLQKSDADTARWPSNDEFSKAVETDQLYRLLTRGRLRLILRAIDKAIESEKTEDIQLPDELTIEHLLPQNWQEHWPISGRDEADKVPIAQRRDQLKHTLGNLTLLTKKLNPAISNAAWTVKRPEITKQSKLNLNRDFYDQFEWGENQIEERGGRFSSILQDLWPR